MMEIVQLEYIFENGDISSNYSIYRFFDKNDEKNK